MENSLRVFLKKKNIKAQSYWYPLFNGYISAAGAPSKKGLKMWAEEGVTDVVTLLRTDEMEKWLPSTCERLGLRWHHFPLSGKHLSSENDLCTLQKVSGIVDLLQATLARNVVVHCAAGMHRTGVFLYFVMRKSGVVLDNIPLCVQQVRGVTGEELVKTTSKGQLLEKANELYSSLL